MKNILTIAFCFSILAATFFSQTAYSSVGVLRHVDKQQAEKDAREAEAEAEADEETEADAEADEESA